MVGLLSNLNWLQTRQESHSRICREYLSEILKRQIPRSRNLPVGYVVLF
jgi:hypothetical protein